MAKLDQLIREIDRQVKLEGHLYGSVWAKLRDKYATPPAKPIPLVRHKPRVRKTVVRLGRIGMEALRREVYERDNGRCQWVGCGRWAPEEGHELVRAHLAHIVSRGRGGSDTPENTRILCPEHHLVSEHNPKSVARKDGTQ